MPTPISTPTLACRVQPSPQVLLQQTGSEAIVLDLASEHYFGLNEVGTRLWQLLALNPDLGAAHRTLLGEYDVPAERLEQDLIALVGQLTDAGLVTLG